MEKNENHSCVLKLLRRRNAKESSYKEIIRYSNKLLESLDYLQKASIPKHIQISKSEESSLDSMRSHEHSPKEVNSSLKNELAECHAKISNLAEQVIGLKDALDDKDRLIIKYKAELDQVKSSAISSQELCKTLKSDLSSLKKILQDKSDEFDALNITYSSIENKKNALEIENKMLLEQISRFRELSKKTSSSDSLDSVFSLNTSTGSGKSLQKTEIPEATLEPPKILIPKASSGVRNVATDSSLPEAMKLEFTAHDSEVNSVMWFPDSAYIFTAGADRRVKLWEICGKDVKLIKFVRDCNSSVMSIDMDSEASLVLCASCDFASRVWTIADFTIRHTLTGHSGKVTSAKFMNESYKIVSCSLDQTLKLWDFPRRVCTVTYKSQSPVNDVISKDSSTIISGHNDNKLRFWDIRSKSEISNIQTSGRVTSIDISRNRNVLLASEQGKSMLKLFDLRTLKEVVSMQANNFEIGSSWTRVKFNPNGKYCCCGSINGSVFIWNTSTGVLVKELKGHTSNVLSCSWSICGSYLATCDSNRKCIIWSK